MYLPRHRFSELEDAYGDVVLARCQDVMRNYDPARVPPVLPITFLCANVRWYAFKHLVSVPRYRRERGEPRRQSLDDMPVDLRPSYLGGHEASVEVEMILAQLPDEAADLLRWVHLRGNDAAEIADHLGMPRKEVRRLTREAEALAREIAVADRSEDAGREVLRAWDEWEADGFRGAEDLMGEAS